MNRYLTYQEGELFFEDVSLDEISQEMYTPFYVYSKAAILEKVEAFKQAFSDIKPMMAFSMKALDTTLILKILQERGCALEVSSLSELDRALLVGFKPTSIIYNAYSLPDNVIPELLKRKPLIINVSNIFELEPLNRYASELDTGVRIGLRINPGIDVGGFFGTNIGTSDSHIGIQKNDIDLAVALISKLPQLNLVGISCQLGSQVVKLAPWIKLSEEMAAIFNDIKSKGYSLEYLDLGSGFPASYSGADYLEIKKIARNITPHVKDLDCRIVLEPGRCFTAESGLLVTSVLGVKEIGPKFYVICDAGFSEFPRSAMYRLSHGVIPIKELLVEPADDEEGEGGGAFSLSGESEDPVDVATGMADPGEFMRMADLPGDHMKAFETSGQLGTARPPGDKVKADIVGPGDEGLDYLARDVEISVPKRGDLLVVLNVGAYGRTMASNYGSRVRPPEVLIERDKFEIIRERENVDDLIALDLEESEIEV